jgi:hypothetical protein
MTVGVKHGLIVVSTVLLVLLQNGCEVLDQLRTQEAKPQTVAEQANSESEPAPVIEPFTEQPSGWNPVLPHELDAQFEESDLLLKLFRYSRRLGSMTPQQLDQEYQSFKTLSEQQKSAVGGQLRHALLLSAQTASFRDVEGAKRILTKVINAHKQRGVMLREYAYNLLVTIDRNEKAQQQNFLLRKKLKSEIERRQALEQKREALEQKLEALKSIEESITQRQNKPEEVTP